MAFYQTETRLDGMNIDWVGYDPEQETVTLHLRRAIKVEESLETVWVDHKIQMPYDLLADCFLEASNFKAEMLEDGITEFDLRKPVGTV